MSRRVKRKARGLGCGPSCGLGCTGSGLGGTSAEHADRAAAFFARARTHLEFLESDIEAPPVRGSCPVLFADLADTRMLIAKMDEHDRETNAVQGNWVQNREHQKLGQRLARLDAKFLTRCSR